MSAEVQADQAVAVVDDDPAARESLAALLASRGYAVETFSSAEDFLAKLPSHRRGCVIADVRMTGMNGVELLERLVRDGFRLPVIIITGFASVPLAVRAMRAGAYSFLEKGGPEGELWETIEAALSEEARASERSVRRQEIRQRLAELTADEENVLQRLVAGEANKTIAAALDIGLRTVELRRATILKKLHARSLAELVRFVLLAGESARDPGGFDA